jgi:hypothetical protein
MRNLSTRLTAVSAAAVLAAGLTACGGGDSAESDNAAAPPAAESTMASPTAEATASAGALTPEQFDDPFVGARKAAEHMPMTATALATGFAKATDAAGVDSDAAKLRSDLTYLLSEHVYLAGLGINTALVTSPSDPKTEAALAALDENSVALSEAVGSVSDDASKEAFLQAWRSHIKDFVSYATAKDSAGEKAAEKNLDAYRESAGKLFDKVTKGAVPASAVEKTLETHVDSLLAAVDDMKAGKSTAYDKLYEAAGHMPMTAAALSKGFAKAADISGDTDSAGSELRAGLTGLLTGHVYLAGTAVFTAYTDEGGATGKPFEAAAATLAQNTDDLTEAVGKAAPEQKKAFNQAWTSHIEDFVAYAQAAAKGDQSAKDKELADLDGYRGSAGKLFETATKGALPADAVSESLGTHVESLAGTIDALAKALVTK